jgi:L-ascorbate metabolism protein UlaG (beta-lactamase superfamily)
MQLTWLGHSCVLLSGSKKVLIDPFVEGGSVLNTDPDLVAVTHGHSDHMGETVALGKKPLPSPRLRSTCVKRACPQKG